MAGYTSKDARQDAVLLLVFFFVLFFLVEEISIFTRLALLFLLFFLFVEVIGDEVQMHGMSLRHFQFGFALGATQDFALLDFVFVHIDFGGTLGAAVHGSILR